MFDDMQVFKCPSCKDIILVVLPGDTVDEAEFNAKVFKHEQEHEKLERMLDE